MPFSNPLSFVSMPKSLRTFWARISFNKLTTIYFVFSILHCIIQVSFQTRAFVINNEAADFMYNILRQGGAHQGGEFAVLMPNDTIRMCITVPDNEDPVAFGQCREVWDGVPKTNWIAGQSATPAPTPSSTSSQESLTTPIQNNLVAPTPSGLTTTVFVPPTPVNNAAPAATIIDLADFIEEAEDNDDDDDDEVPRGAAVIDRRQDAGVQFTNLTASNGQTALRVTGMGYNDVEAELDKACLWALNYPVSILHNTKREDLTFIGFQIWVLGMSIVALLNESIPHILASLLTHILATGWAVYQIFHTMQFQDEFKRVISNGACNGTQLLTNYWKDRAMAEIPGLALNGLGLLLSGFLTYKLFKLFGWQTFKRIGASLTINRLYKVVLSLSITIQLAGFFVAVTVGLWLDQLINTNLGRQATVGIGYKAASIVILFALIPWLFLGWMSVRKEHRISMFLFLAISIIYLAGFGAMFFSWTFLWEFKTWRFFSVMSSLSVALTFGSLVLGIVSFFNFGKGLPRYLEAQEELPGDEFPPVKPGDEDIEKVAFPTTGPIPTFSAAFGTGNQVPVPTKMFPQRQAGPRFFRSAEPFESSSEDRTTIASGDGSDLQRTPSNVTESSIGSYYSYSENRDAGHAKNNRWVIE